MQRFKKKVNGLMLLMMIVISGFFVATPLKAHAAANVPKTVNCGIGVRGCQFIIINHGSGERIKNLKSNSSNMRARVDGIYSIYSESTYISVYCKKAGTYKLSFDLYTKNNKKIKSYSVTVYGAKCWKSTNGNIKSIQLDGKDIEEDLAIQMGTDAKIYYTTKTSAKVKVTVSKNVTLKKIIVSTYSKNGKFVEKVIKNGSKAMFSTIGIKNDDNYGGSIFQQKAMLAESVIKITVQAKGAPDPETVYIYVDVPARTWAMPYA